MGPNMNLVAESGKLSLRLLTDEEIRQLRAEELKHPLGYGLVTSLGWNFNHTKVGNVIIFDVNNAVKVSEDTYVMDERMVLARFVENEPAEGGFFKGLRE